MTAIGRAVRSKGRAVNTRYGFVSTFPPTQCGLATFAASLRAGLVRHGGTEGVVVRLVETPEPRPAPEVVAQIVMGDRARLHRGVARLNQCDIAILQHEYGVYGGTDGDEILLLLDALTVPSIVVLHTVLVTPSRNQRRVLEAVVAKADSVVTMSMTARDRLAAGYDVDMRKVSIIAHGAPVAAADDRRRRRLPQRAASRTHLGTAGAGQGHRVGHRGDGEAARPGPDAAIHHRRPDPPQGGAARGRDLPQLAAGTCSPTRPG